MHCDKHVVKMILETAQMLSTIYHIYGSGDLAPYKPTHAKHPSTLWAAESVAQYDWLQQLGVYLCNEYALRYGRRHACEQYIKGVLDRPPPALMAKHKFLWREPPQAMPDDCKVEGDSITAYRNYYRKYKSVFAQWKLGGVPAWMLPTYNKYSQEAIA
tara:strand:- start:1678 stop:2151 length:474 start_codon:yes stop_codon:yes gene_type:complete